VQTDNHQPSAEMIAVNLGIIPHFTSQPEPAVKTEDLDGGGRSDILYLQASRHRIVGQSASGDFIINPGNTHRII